MTDNQPETQPEKKSALKEIIEMVHDYREPIGLILKGGTYLALLIIMFILGKMATIQQIEYVQDICPGLEYEGNVFELSARYNTTPMGMLIYNGTNNTGVLNGGNGKG